MDKADKAAKSAMRPLITKGQKIAPLQLSGSYFNNVRMYIYVVFLPVFIRLSRRLDPLQECPHSKVHVKYMYTHSNKRRFFFQNIKLKIKYLTLYWFLHNKGRLL